MIGSVYYCCVIFTVSHSPNWVEEGFIVYFASPVLTPVYYLFQVIRSHDLGNWTLQIKYPHLRDNGVYECQINTEPKMSLSYVLNVVGKRNCQHVAIIALKMFLLSE